MMSTIAQIAIQLRADVAAGKTQRGQLRTERPGQVRQRLGIAATDQQISKAQRAADAQLDAEDARTARDDIAMAIRAKYPGATVTIRRGRKEYLIIEVMPFASEGTGGGQGPGAGGKV